MNRRELLKGIGGVALLGLAGVGITELVQHETQLTASDATRLTLSTPSIEWTDAAMTFTPPPLAPGQELVLHIQGHEPITFAEYAETIKLVFDGTNWKQVP